MTNVLTLIERSVAGDTWKRRWLFFRRAEERAEVHLDFVIDGKPLRTWVQEWRGATDPPDEASLITQADPDLAVEQIDRLLGRRAHQYWDRGWPLFCPACWDEGCGGVTADHPSRRRKGSLVRYRLG